MRHRNVTVHTLALKKGSRLLTERFSEVHLFDPRDNLSSIKGYVEEHGIDMVLVLYSFANFTTDSNLFVLAR